MALFVFVDSSMTSGPIPSGHLAAKLVVIWSFVVDPPRSVLHFEGRSFAEVQLRHDEVGDDVRGQPDRRV